MHAPTNPVHGCALTRVLKARENLNPACHGEKKRDHGARHGHANESQPLERRAHRNNTSRSGSETLRVRCVFHLLLAPSTNVPTRRKCRCRTGLAIGSMRARWQAKWNGAKGKRGQGGRWMRRNELPAVAQARRPRCVCCRQRGRMCCNFCVGPLPAATPRMEGPGDDLHYAVKDTMRGTNPKNSHF